MRRGVHADHDVEDAGLPLTRRSTARLVASYVRARVLVAWSYDDMSLSALLERLDRSFTPSGIARGEDLVGAIVLAERIVRRMRLDPDTCLFRSLARYAAARRAGREARFVMAVDRGDPSTGHAWAELDGRAVLEDDLDRWLPTFAHPARERRETVTGVQRQ